eukprot:c34226_g1_i1 orf=3-473(-)
MEFLGKCQIVASSLHWNGSMRYTGNAILLNSVWWSRMLSNDEMDIKTARYLNNKGIVCWADLWDGHGLGWRSLQQLKTMFGLKTQALPLLNCILDKVSSWLIPHCIDDACFFTDWNWPVDSRFVRSITKNVYLTLLPAKNWHFTLNNVWEKNGSAEW